MHKDIQEILLSEEQIKSRIQEMGVELMRDYAGKKPVFICILKGAVVFYVDMIRAFDDHCEMEFMQISSYQAPPDPPGLPGQVLPRGPHRR